MKSVNKTPVQEIIFADAVMCEVRRSGRGAAWMGTDYQGDRLKIDFAGVTDLVVDPELPCPIADEELSWADGRWTLVLRDDDSEVVFRVTFEAAEYSVSASEA